MSVLVTGAAGMIGRALCARLAAEGRTVLGTDRSVPEDLPAALPGCTIREIDTNESERLRTAIAEAGVTRIVHCGAISGPMVANRHPELVFEANVLGTQNLLEAARHSGVARVVFLSSIMAYGPQPAAFDEDAPLRADEPYGASKICGEALLRAYGSTQGIDGTALRVAMVYGPRRATGCLLRDAIRAGFEGRPLVLPFGRGWHRQYIHLDDVIEAIIRTLDRDRLPRPAYNVTAEARLSLDEIAEVLAEAVPGTRLVLDGEGHPHDYPTGPMSGTAARTELGFSARIGLADGLRRYAAHLRAHPI